jgi:hypothetical protein
LDFRPAKKNKAKGKNQKARVIGALKQATFTFALLLSPFAFQPQVGGSAVVVSLLCLDTGGRRIS